MPAPATLHRSDALDHPPDAALDELTSLAAELLDAPMAVMALADGDLWRFKARAGVVPHETPREAFFPEDAARDLVVLRDTAKDPRSAKLPWVRGEPYVRFFAAVPLHAEGRHVGMLCVMDTRPRELLPLQGRTLLALASAAMDRLELGPAQVRELTRKLRETVSEQARTLEQLRHADRLGTVGKLTASVAHELGTPLNVVSGRARLIEGGEVQGPDVVASAKVIVEQVDRMTVMLRQLLDFARRQKPQRQRLELAPLARRTVSLLEPLATKARVTLEWSEPVGPIVAEVDGGLILQALTNLVVNAIQASPPGGGTVRVALERLEEAPPDRPERVQPCAAYSVTDSGSGMAPEVLARVFEAFFTTKPPGEGTGLGLSVTREIVREHGGWITARSTVGKGSTFTLLLPLPVGPAHAATLGGS